VLTNVHHSYKAYVVGKNVSANMTGNHKKSMMTSLRDTLAKLQTDYVSRLIECDLKHLTQHRRIYSLTFYTSIGYVESVDISSESRLTVVICSVGLHYID
jgi:hypothetical protein